MIAEKPQHVSMGTGEESPLIARFVDPDDVHRVDVDLLPSSIAARQEFSTVIARRQLQWAADYRRQLQSWFELVKVGGFLVVTVPHAFLFERQTELPSRWDPRQRRLYTAGILLSEVEEALVPNSYRVRLVADDDSDYDYEANREVRPTTAADVVLVLERIAAPAWGLFNTLDMQRVRADAPDYVFEPVRTRVEVTTLRPHRRILLLKLDHLGDFVMGLQALRRARQIFAGSHITLVVGSWNTQMARDLSLADEVIGFDAFPRNSTEEEPNVSATIGRFRELVGRRYDLAIDMRTDTDTRILLREVNAPLKAGVGTPSQFSFLDIFLPLDFNRNDVERAREDTFNHHAFAYQAASRRQLYRDEVYGESVDRSQAIIWGPYYRLRSGDYIFEPFMEINPIEPGLLRLDISLNGESAVERFAVSQSDLHLPFHVGPEEAAFEFRVWATEGHAVPDFNFFGGRLIRKGGASVLHQSEYIALLIELVAMRIGRTGMLTEITRA